ncbi:MAG TPA: NUDIX hydrolase, partial [Sphingomicrobium sp.]|nr:NUDIX hydrolase [Sphingomicrobium sp.]
MSEQAIPAATLIVVRERSEGPPELLMVERAGSMAFAAGAWVFPGGRIDESDCRIGEESSLHPGAVAAIR